MSGGFNSYRCLKIRGSIVSILLILGTLVSGIAWSTDTRSTNGFSHSFSMIVESNARNRYGANITIDYGHMSLNEVPEKLLPPQSDPIEVVIVVPKGASPFMRQEFKAQVESQIQSRYSRSSFRIVESFVDVQQDIASLEAQGQQIAEVSRNFAPGSAEADLAAAAQRTIRDGIAEDQEFLGRWHDRAFNQVVSPINNTHPYNTVLAARVVAVTKLGISAAVLISKYGLNPMSAVIAGISGGISAAFGYKAKNWSEWCTSHQFPWFQDAAPVQWYNSHGWFKSATINFMRSLALSAVLRELAWASHQTVRGQPVAPAHTLQFVVEGLGITLPEIFLDGLMDDGLRSLELNHHINHQTRSYTLWGISMIDTAMHSFFRAGAVKLAYTAAFISWGSKLAVFGASKLLTPKPRRFVFISDQISNQAQTQLVENKTSFLNYVLNLGRSILNTFQLRRSGRFSESDRNMVRQTLSLAETWNLALTPEQLEVIETDPNLKREEFRKLLNLQDTDNESLDRLWMARQRSLSFMPAQRFQLLRACEEALTTQ